MKITADTNVLLRAFLADDETQAKAALEALDAADLIAVSLPSLCEFVWVLKRRYGASRADVAAAVRRLLDTEKIVVDRPAGEAGLALLEAGDFADGVIDFEGRRLGGETFVSFDRTAVKHLLGQGRPALLLN